MSAIKYKDPSTNLWEEVGEIIKGKDAAYVGSSAPTDPQYTIWVDTSETGEGLVTSVNGQVGAVMLDTVHVGSSSPTDPNIDIWLDTDEPGQTVVTSFNGQSGPVTYDPYSPVSSGEVSMATDVTQPSGWHQYWQRFGRLVFVDIYIENKTESTFADDKQLATGFPAPLGSYTRMNGETGGRPISAEIDSNGVLHLQWSGWINSGDGARFWGWYIAAT